MTHSLKTIASSLGSIIVLLLVFCSAPLGAPQGVDLPPVGSNGMPGIPAPVLAPPPVPERNMIPALLTTQKLDLTAFLDCLVDKNGSMSISDAAGQDNFDKYLPFSAHGIPQDAEVIWLRFVLQPCTDDAREYMLDLGDSVSGSPTLYTPSHGIGGVFEWRESHPVRKGLLALPKATKESPTVCFLRIEGQPGRWFTPLMRTPQDAMADQSGMYRLAALIALGVIAVLSLLRGLSAQGGWSVWSFLYVCAVLAQGWLGIPAIKSHPTPMDMAALALPGLALAILPLAGRQIMRGRERARIIDFQYIVLVLPGLAALAAPFIPGYQWVARFADLWPLAIVLLLPTTLCACLCGLSGSFQFLLGCVIPPACASAAILGYKIGIPAELSSVLPLWGTAIGALFVAGTSSGAPRFVAIPQPSTMPEVGSAPVNINASDGSLSLDAPDIGLSSNVLSISAGNGGLQLMDDVPSTQPQPIQQPQPQAEENLSSADPDLKGKLHEPLSNLLSNATALSREPISPSAQFFVSSLVGAATEINSLVLGNQSNIPAPLEKKIFNLMDVMMGARAALDSMAKSKKTELGWNIQVSPDQTYEGFGDEIKSILVNLLSGILANGDKGTLRCSVRRMPDDASNGHLVFRIATVGSGYMEIPATSSLARLRRLVRMCDGSLTMEALQNEMDLSFTLHLTPCETDTAKPAQNQVSSAPAQEAVVPTPSAAPAAVKEVPSAQAMPQIQPSSDAPAIQTPSLNVILLCDDNQIVQSIGNVLRRSNCQIRKAVTMGELLQMFSNAPAHMIVLQGRAAMPGIKGSIDRINEECRKAGKPIPAILAYTLDESSWRALAKAGFTHALTLPVIEAKLRETLIEVRTELASAVMESAQAPIPDIFGMDAPQQAQPSQRPLTSDLSLDMPTPRSVSTSDMLLSMGGIDKQ